MATSNGDQITTGELSMRVRVREGAIRRAADAGHLPHERIGRLRVFRACDLDQIRAKLKDLGHEPAGEANAN